MLAIVPSAVLHGIDGRPVRVEVHVSQILWGAAVDSREEALVNVAGRVRDVVADTALLAAD